MGVVRKTKSLIKSAFPGSVAIYAKLITAYQRSRSMTAIFSEIYQKNRWEHPESPSGRGSTLAYTVTVRNALPSILKDAGAKSLLDAGCGDFNWMRHIQLDGIKYIGADVVPALIAQNQQIYGNKEKSFFVLDITKDQLPRVDVILCRQCLYHLSFRHIHAAIANFKKSGSTYLLATTQKIVEENRNVPTGGWRFLNLQRPPLNFPPPLKSLVEYPVLGECLSLWRLEDL